MEKPGALAPTFSMAALDRVLSFSRPKRTFWYARRVALLEFPKVLFTVEL